MSFVLFLPDWLTSTGSCFLLHNVPMTIGVSISPCSNTTRSWSSGSGRKYVPRSGPPIGTAMRAQNVFSSLLSHGSFTFTR